ncbi:Mu transposase C-terminal domain-containing protein [Burkholderia thailandensis]|uniref:Mu transposase C-terminal domain-containing protein n=1 Tax=Burkholderia thailandensis TaxID=57975 RepID=UPI0022AC42BB|nr:Mu transposase C-terminal domain-containing protein [Burkholderia thailandensis]MCZ2900947.1 transposase family protein [Burkholderia thailandensis]MDD1480973.1 transposase [Burkholderia thailandensis]MDD1489134.1 transposase [Burkholderia thailandensis]MDD1493912.1 transposase [Burkholderia thailandensis]
MTRTLLLHDRLAPPRNHDAYLEVLDPTPRRGHVKVFDAEKREDRYVSLVKILADIHAGELMVLRLGKPRFSHAAQPDDNGLHERSLFIYETMRRIHSIQKQRGLSFRQAYRLAAEEYGSEAASPSYPFPPESTMYRYRKSEMAGLPVLRGNKNKGNREPRYPKEVVDTICTVAEQHYLVPMSRWSLKRVTDDVNLKMHGTFLPATGAAITTRYVKNTIRRFASADPEHDRMLPMDAVAGKSFAKRRIRAEAPFERVEQDALHLPFVLETPSGVTSQLYLVHAVDCCTSYPLGWHLIVGAPTDRESLACAEMYMAPVKLKRFKEMGIDHDMNVCGTPGQLVFDNGPEAKTSRIQNLERLGVDVKHCRARAGHEKPYIERLNRSLKEALEGLPGCTRMDGKDGQRDPIALGDQLMTLDELERWIVRWYYERWIHAPLERLQWDAVLSGLSKGDTPAERWKYFEESCFAISLPPSRAEWLAALYEHTERRLSRKTGITIDGLHYKGDHIGPLIARYGEQRPVRVLFNRDDFRRVYVYEGDDFPLVALSYEHLTPETPAWSFSEAKDRFKKHKSGFRPAPQAEKFDRDMHARASADSLAPKRKKPSKYDRNRETARREKEARAIERATKQPSPQLPSAFTTGGPNAGQVMPSTAVSPISQMLGEVSLLPLVDRESGDLLK